MRGPDLDVLILDRTPADLARIAHDHPTGYFRLGTHVHVADGTIRARHTTGGRSGRRVTLRGVLRAETGGTRVLGRVRSSTEILLRGVFLFATVLLLVSAVALVVSGEVAGVGFAVSAGGALLLGLVTVGMFATGGRAALAREMQAALDDYFG